MPEGPVQDPLRGSCSLDLSLLCCETSPVAPQRCHGMWGLLGVSQVGSRALLGQCLDAWGCSTNSSCHLPALRFQGDSSFVVMTNFIVTPQQAQGYCAEVRTLALSWIHREIT